MKDLLNLLEEYDVEFCWIDKSTVGIIDPEDDVVKINLYLLIAETLMHEVMHNKFPNLDEIEIERKARIKIQRMPVIKIKEMVDFIVAIRRTDEEAKQRIC